MRIGIIGGGASGLVASIFAKDNNNEVVIFERNNDCGKKILVTGNGRCNYWNDDQDLSHYQSSDDNFIRELIKEENFNLVLDFFKYLGVVPKIKNGYYYPFSNQASTIKETLIKEANKRGVSLRTNTLITNIKKINDKFILIANNEEIEVDKLIIATGSLASPKTGSDGMGYDFLKKLGHTVIKPLPSLLQLKTSGNYLKIWQGIRTEARVSLCEEGKLIKEELGEIQLTNYGISGICIFNLSNYVVRGLDNNKKEEIYIDFLPFIEEDKMSWFINQSKITNKTIKELLLSILNKKIVEVIFIESKLNPNKNFMELNDMEKNKLIYYCTSFKVNIIGSNTYDEAQVCSGGIKLSEVNLNTMESKYIKNLYITGELLDITGDCGGYNLGIAWITGIKAGTASKGDTND